VLETAYKELHKLDEGYEYWYRLSSGTTPKEFNAWATKHSNQLKKALTELGVSIFEKVSKGHFGYTMFAFSEKTGWIYLSVGDVRSPLTQILIRTATSNKDYTGGRNNWIDLKSGGGFERTLRAFISQVEI